MLRHCPNLETLEIDYVYEDEDLLLDDDTPICDLPKLKHLSLCGHNRGLYLSKKLRAASDAQTPSLWR